jgi:hypothetical protein
MFALSWPTSLAEVKCERPSLGALPFTNLLTHVLHNFLFSRYTVEVYRLGDLCKSGYKIYYLVGM